MVMYEEEIYNYKPKANYTTKFDEKLDPGMLPSPARPRRPGPWAPSLMGVEVPLPNLALGPAHGSRGLAGV